MVRHMSKLTEVSYRAITELIDLNPKSAAVAAECIGRAIGLDTHLGLVVGANSAWRTEIKPKLIPFLNENLPVVIQQVESFSTAYPNLTPLIVTTISLITAYKMETEIEYPGLQENYEEFCLKNNLKEKFQFLDLLEQNPFSIKKDD